MASDTDNVQSAYMAVLEEEVFFAIRAYTGPKHPDIDIDVFLEPLMQEMETLWKEGIDIYMMVLHGSPLILELLYSSLPMIIKHCLSCQDRSKVGRDAR